MKSFIRTTTPVLSLLSLTILLSCSQAATETTNANAPAEITYVSDLKGEGEARIMIEGMTCSRMCVSAVTKGIKAMPGVSFEEMRFDADQSIDTLIVNFDASTVNEQAIIETIEGLAGGGIYHVKEVQLPKSAAPAEEVQDQKTSHVRSDKSEDTYRFQVPNFLEMLRRVSI